MLCTVLFGIFTSFPEIFPHIPFHVLSSASRIQPTLLCLCHIFFISNAEIQVTPAEGVSAVLPLPARVLFESYAAGIPYSSRKGADRCALVIPPGAIFPIPELDHLPVQVCPCVFRSKLTTHSDAN